LGVAAPSETEVDPTKEYDTLHTRFFAKKEMSVDEANILGKEFLAKALNDWQNGVKERHITRAESKMIREEGSYVKLIKKDIVPYFSQFENCDFEALEGYFEMANQIMRAKLRAVRKSGGSLFGSKKVLTKQESDRRKVVAEHAMSLYELLKSTQLCLDALNWRTTDIRLAEAEY
jgi:hypothetical protein